MIKQPLHVIHPHYDPAYEEWLSHTSTYPTEKELESMETSFRPFPLVLTPANSINYNPNDQGA